jgi:hypothetical protein
MTEAQAVPAFARQTGMACTSCHAQNFPAINSFGRVFKAQGYTMRGAAPLVEGDELSIPAELKASVIAKVRYQVQEDDDRGEIQWPDEAALLVGGRAAEKVGFLMELGLGPQEAAVDTGTGSLTCTNPADATTCVADTGTGEGEGGTNFLSAKFHFNVTNDIAAVLFATDGLSVGYGFELLNTGAHRSQRPIENRDMSAYSFMRQGSTNTSKQGLGTGAATGLALVYHKADYYVNYTHWAPTFGNVDANLLGGLGHFVRAAYMPNIGGWDTGFAFQYQDGSIDVGETDPAATVHFSGWGVDAQAQGTVGTMPLGLYASYAVAPKSSSSESNRYNSSTTDDLSSLGMVAKLGVMPNKMIVYAGYASVSDAVAANDRADTTVGLQYMAAQNINFEVYNVSSDKDGADYYMLQMFAAF